MILTDERIGQLTREACNVLRDTDNDYQESAVRGIIERYAEAKAPLIAMLRQSEDWDEDNLAIIQKHTMKRGRETEKACTLVRQLNHAWEIDSYLRVHEDSADFFSDVFYPRVIRDFLNGVGARWGQMSKEELTAMLSNLHIKPFYQPVKKQVHISRADIFNTVTAYELIPTETTNLEHNELFSFVAECGGNYKLCENCDDFSALQLAKDFDRITSGQFRVTDPQNFGNYIVNYAETEEGYAEFVEYWEKWKQERLSEYDGLKRERDEWLHKLIKEPMDSQVRVECIKRLEKITGKSIGKKLKTTRVLQRYFEYLYQRIDRLSKATPADAVYDATTEYAHQAMKNYAQVFARVCDLLTEKDFEREVVLSVHPVDYLLMSNGGNPDDNDSWESCHNIVDGCHRSGTISYMLDGTSLVGYTTKVQSHRTNMAYRYKINRQVQMVWDNADAVVHSRLYPRSTDKALFTQLSGIVRAMLTSATGADYAFSTTSAESTMCKKMVSTGYGATLYPDWLYGYYTQLWSTVKLVDLGGLEVGVQPRCVVCGHKHSVTGSMTCEDC